MMLQWHATWLAIAFGLTVACPPSPAQDRPLTAFASDPGAAADDLLENAAYAGVPDDEQVAAGLAEAWHLVQQGRASWYGGRRWHGRRTASGERFDRKALTAAHPAWPFGTWVRVVNPANGREVHVRINDRGPTGQRFIIDLSEAAAEQLGLRRLGTAPVRLYHRVVPNTEISRKD